MLSALRAEAMVRARPIPGQVMEDEEAQPHQLALSEDLRILDPFSTRVRFARNETIFCEGDSSDYAFKIISGTVRLCAHTPDGRRQISDFMLPGDVFGLMERSEYGFSAEAVTDVLLVSYPRNKIDQLWATKPQVVIRVLAALAKHFSTMQRHLVVLGCQSAKERVASFFLRLSERTQSEEGELIDLSMGRQDIASHLGLTIETVCRAIGELKREGAITTPNLHEFILNDLGALRTLTGDESEH
jgi:CRP/FNR family nitrogen fixation transcriptional regulator